MTRWHGSPLSIDGDPLEALPRLSKDLFVPFIDPGFVLSRNDEIFAIGSCFARSVEHALGLRGLSVLSLTEAFDGFPLIEGAGRPIGFTNKYNPPSILNELRWALDPESTYPQEAFVAMQDGTWMDPHANPTLVHGNLETTKARRQLLSETFSNIARCRCVVITLGLIEAWFDTKTNLYLNGSPPRSEIGERFRFRVLSFDEVRETLNDIYGLLVRFGHPRVQVVVTVSPVPLMATFRSQDVVLANSASKALLRAAVDEWVRGKQNVHYFPSFEIVMNSNPALTWELDRRHVKWEVVDHIMDLFLSHYVRDGDAIVEQTDGRFEGE
jgi:hypothetical protein